MSVASKTPGCQLDEHLKYISVRTQWGCQKEKLLAGAGCSTVLAGEGKELLLVSGSRVVLYDEEEGMSGERRLLPTIPDVQSVVTIGISNDKKLAVACVRRGVFPNKAVALVYELEVTRAHPAFEPHVMVHEDTSTSSDQEFVFSGAVFSNDNKLLACFSADRVGVGVLIFDWKLRKVVHTVKLKNAVHTMSFNPLNSSRICTGGSNGMFQFWHCTSKSSYSAPIGGLHEGVTYTAHAWLGGDCLLAGTSDGSLLLVVGCDVKVTCNAFGSKTSVKSPVTGLHLKGGGADGKDADGALLLAYSREGFVSVSRVTRSQGRGTSDTVVQLYHCLLQDSPSISGLAWRSTRLESLVVVVATVGAIHTYDLAVERQHMLRPPVVAVGGGGGSSSEEAAARAEQVRVQAVALENARSLSYWEDNDQARQTWSSMPSSRLVMSFHHGAVRQLATSCRNALVVTCSQADSSVRLWDYSRVDSSERLTLSYAQNRTELPLAMDIHPSGFFVATGTDDFASEHAVTNNKLEPLRKIPVKMALERSTGEAVHNTAHVSLVRYSNGGHLLAVVTGKLAQIYRLNHLTYALEKAGLPDCLMTMTDHHAAITDLAFSSDDSKVFTSSTDGQVFEWTVSRDTLRRDKDFLLKNFSAIRVAVSPSSQYIMAAFRTVQGQRLLAKQTSTNTVDGDIPSSARTRRESDDAGGMRRSLLKTMSHGEESSSSGGRAFLVLWKDNITSNDGGEVVMELETPVTAISFGRLDSRDSPEVCVLGLCNGTVLISLLPLPLRAFVPSPNKSLHNLASFSRDQRSLRDMRSTIAKPPTLVLDGGENSLEDDFFDLVPIEERNGARGETDIDFLNADGVASPGTIKKKISRGESFSGYEDRQQQYMTIDSSQCRVLQLHDGPVLHTCVSATGLWFFTCGQDGSIFMLNSSLRAKETVEVVESQSNENSIILTDRVALKNSLNTMEDKDSLIEEMEKDFEKSSTEMTVSMKNERQQLNEVMTREIAKRDDIIMQGRNDLLQLKTKNAENLASVHKNYRDQLAELEVMYERKLAHESLYLQNMKQAYDEFVTHARMDLEENNRQAQLREQSLHQKNEDINAMTEKNKKILLQYCEYVGDRHREVLSSLTEQHDKDKEALNVVLREKQEEVMSVKSDFRHEKVKTKREMQKLGAEMTAKDMEVLNTAQELERVKDRASRLEIALQNAMDDIGRKQDALDRWEFKSGEQQQKLSELERVRKALVSQLHALREEMGPKDMKIIKTVDKLNEVDREYDKSIKAISEKEQKLAQNSNTLNLMSKQVRELRLSVTNKEKALKRASQLLDEFNFSLQQARFLSHKTTVRRTGAGGEDEWTGGGGDDSGINHENEMQLVEDPGVGKVALPRGTKKTGKLNFGMGGEIVELISSTPAMEMALTRLYDVLHPHKDIEDGGLGDEEKVINEKDRQITVLRNNITGLKANIKLNESVANLKIHNYLTNNEHLNEEMNSLRKNITKLSLENDALKAFIANEERARNARKPAEMMTVDGETANKRLPPFEQKIIEPSMPDPGVSMSETFSEDKKSRATSSLREGRPEQPTRSSSSTGERERNIQQDVSEDTSSTLLRDNSTDSMTRADKMINELFLANTIAIAEENMKLAREEAGSTSSSHSGIFDPRKGTTFARSGQVPVVALGFEEKKRREKGQGGRYSTKVVDNVRGAAKGKKLKNAPSAPSLRPTGLSATSSTSQSQSAVQFPKLNKTSK